MLYRPEFPSVTTGISRDSVLARKRIRDHLQGSWQLDTDFFDRFFPVNAPVLGKLSEIKKQLYVESEINPRWSGCPKDPKSVNARLYTGLNNLLNSILVFFLSPSLRYDKRLFIKTYRRKVRGDSESPIWPGILYSATSLGLITSSSNRPIAHYSAAICPLEVVLEGVDMEVAQQRLATVVHEIFNHQPNRRYAFGLVISPRTLTCYLFDHSGVVISPSLDYHAQPDQLCALVAGLAVDSPMHTGLDISICGTQSADLCVYMGSPVEDGSTPHPVYYVDRPLYHAPCLIGRGTTCFLAHQESDPKTPYVIKDAWISMEEPELEGRESEASLLLHAKSKGVVQGIAQISHYEEVQYIDRDGKVLVDNVYNIRRLAPSEYSFARQRVHTRMVLSTYGKPLEEFSSRKELLVAYYDAVRAHRNLYERADILHRDIKPGNILINPDGPEGGRGVLIDFDRAIRTDNTSPYSLRQNIGTHLFMSANALMRRDPQGYIDDLESFYYVLIYILVMFSGPRRIKETLPDALEKWISVEPAGSKQGQFLKDPSRLGIEPWFGPVFNRLAQRLQLIFRARILNSTQTPPPIPPGPIQESDKFIAHIHQAIVELDDEESARSIDDVIPQPPAGRLPTRRWNPPHTLAAQRALRSNVNYSRRKKY